MTKIQILGTGCPKCQKLTQNAEAAMQELGIDGQIEKVADINEIIKFGVMITPALVVDGQVIAVGKVLTTEQIKEMLV